MKRPIEVATQGQQKQGRVFGSGWMGCVGALLWATSCGGPELGIPPETCSTRAVDEGESPTMEPGGNCIGCHGAEGGPRYTFAGTVMAALDDDTNCAGVRGVTVTITDAEGQQFEIGTNATGNFFSSMSAGNLVFPYTASVTRNGITIPMVTPRSRSETNCAVCHTAEGANGAPGRILDPGSMP